VGRYIEPYSAQPDSAACHCTGGLVVRWCIVVMGLYHWCGLSVSSACHLCSVSWPILACAHTVIEEVGKMFERTRLLFPTFVRSGPQI